MRRLHRPRSPSTDTVVPTLAPTSLAGRLDGLELRMVTWWATHGITLARLALGLVFFWFGVLKYFPGASSAEALATHTISMLTFGHMPPHVSLPLLATWECVIGLGLLSGRVLRVTLLLLFAQMVGTFLPLAFFSHETFVSFPLIPTLEGQYIIKNVVLVSSAMVIGATSRGGVVIHDRQAAQVALHTQALYARFRRRFHHDP